MPAAAAARADVARKKVYTIHEVQEQLAYVESLMLTPGVSQNAAVRACRQRFGFGNTRYLTLRRRVLAQWALQDKSEVGDRRAAAVRRIEAMLAHARGAQVRDPKDPQRYVWERPPNHSAVVRYEQLLADLEGTRRPIEIAIHHTVANALANVIGNLPEDRLQEYLQEYLETKRLADERRAELTAHAAE